MTAQTNTKRIYRSEEDRIFAGVCGGFGEYFDIDPVIVRLLWILFIMVGGSGIVLYIIAWLIIPKRPMNLDDEFSRSNP